MKKLIVSFTFALIGLICCYAQANQVTFEASLPDSIKYVLPQFENGRIIYKNGEFSIGKFNISTIDQSIRFFDSDNKEKSVSDLSQIDRISIGKTLFIHNNGDFIGIIADVCGISLGACKKLVFNNSKTGGYGTTSETTNITTISKLYDSGGMSFNLEDTKDYKIKTIPYIYRKNTFYAPSKKQILKSFPDRVDKINTYLAEHEVNFSNFDDLSDLFKAIR